MNNRIDLAVLFKEKGYKIGAEIGVAGGNYSLTLLKTIPDLKLFCIDPWIPYKENRRGGGINQQTSNYELAKERLLPYGAVLIKDFSMEAIKQFEDESLDFVYIDGNHDFDYVMEDLINWSKKVRVGGIISGHDYYHFNNSGVIEAVDAYTKAHNISFSVIGEVRKHRKDDDQPTFYWEKL